MTGRALGIAFAVSLLTLTMGAAGAAANTASIIEESDPAHPAVTSGWQAGTCNAEPPEPGAETCSVATPDQFFEMAGAHPNWGFTQFIVRHGPPPTESPVGEVKTIRVDLPVGLSVNPGATERCPLVVFESGAANCESTHPGSRVGESLVTVAAGPGPLSPVPVLTQVPVYNVEPKAGEAARFGLELAGNEVFLEGDVDWSGDYHEGFTIHVPAALPEDLAPLLGLVGQNGVILKNRLIFNGRSGDGTFLTTPTTCFGPAYQAGWVEGEQPTGPSGSIYSTFLRASSVQEEEEPGYVFPQSAEPALESPIPPESAEGGPTEPKDCDTIPYEPSLAVDPGTEEANSPAPARVDIEVPHLLPDYGAEEREQDSSHTKQATVTLPVGMGINPSAATGLQVCSDAEFGKGTANPVACPPASIIGHAKIESPPLTDELEPQPEEALEGNVYVGRQLSRDPASGDEYRIFIEAKSDRYGISVRLVGKVKADPVTGQLSTTISETPQVPFTSFDLTFNGGPHAVLSSPPTCGPNNSSAVMTPWSGNSPATPSDGFTLSRAPGGGKCAKTLAERPFGPGFATGPASAKAGAFSPVSMQIVRSDGQQELKGADITLPPGMTGKLAGIPYCPESAIAAAAANAGASEAASPSCPAASQVGSATVAAGTGPAPYKIGGKVFLSGPYHGAPLSLAVVTPATAGPFDLGTVVVRVALFVDPETAQIRAVSDPIPDVFGGSQLNVRSIDLAMDRPDFTLNPTSCDPMATVGTLAGGGADPHNPSAFSAFAVSSPFQTTECDALSFKPSLVVKLIGGRKVAKRNHHPKLQAILTAREGDANIKRAALTLPHSLFLDQGHIGTICTRVQLAASSCPARSIYGHATAKTPLLDDELSGPVYLTSSDHELPDLLVVLHGQVDIRLRGVISSVKGRMRTVFEPVPDVPVSKFVMTMKGGKKGLLVNSRDLCLRANRAFLNFKAQNGKKLRKKKLPVRFAACKHHRKHGKKK